MIRVMGRSMMKNEVVIYKANLKKFLAVLLVLLFAAAAVRPDTGAAEE